MMKWIALPFILFSTLAFGQERDCRTLQEYRALDFWLGDWDVYMGNQKVGTNKIEPILNSCAVIENWKDATGAEGKSFFYFDLVDKVWKQVWVTDQGYMKEKVQQKSPVIGEVTFQGEVLNRQGKKILDRTSLVKESNGVRQIIEQSEDAGKTWTVTFDAIYVHHGTSK
ncbi:MAG TPA: hypothetical protein VLH08_02725 [Acidobacteriota bacterium]|nr:hypothetical protein [Acidobacteriota bacterium]